MRDAMLSGRFVGSRDAALADTVSEFLGAPSGEAIDLWFGAERGARLRIDPQALRDAVDRDIAAIDAMLSEQVDAILHHRACASWKARGAASPGWSTASSSPTGSRSRS